MSSLHQRAKDLFLAALELPTDQWAAFLAEQCRDEADLRAEVESLLAFHQDSDPEDDKPEPRDHAFEPGELFAGRYRMIARIGRGGMGDVWRADDLVLDTAVALKLINSEVAAGRERLLNEVRLARQVTHPAVCRVFDIGESELGIFYTMEFVKGEDLSALIRRVGRLPSEKVIDIARQLCGGLAAAHAQGVLHRDLKPANVLIDNEGVVRITDFGIALSRENVSLHTLTGTPAYMAPEQRQAGQTLSERTDIYALGLVLYDLLVGLQGGSHRRGTAVPPRPSTLVPGVDPQLERVVMQALSPLPGDRPQSALEMAASLPPAPPRLDTTTTAPSTTTRWPARPRWWMAAAMLLGLTAVLVLLASFFTAPARTLSEQDVVVLADFENTTGEPVFDGALKVALAVALEQSPFVTAFPDERARDTLRLMRRSPDERITRAIAREIALRERLKALIAGSIARLGTNYVLALEAINAESGDVMAREQAEAAKEDVLASLGTITARLRERLGESLASVERFDVPLARATTSSLDALHAYSLALYERREVPRLEAIPHLKRAIELDPSFAMAHALLSSVYANTGQSSMAPAYAQRAFELRDRVSERERFFISWRYYRDATQAWDKALELAESWAATYPREPFAFNSLGVAMIRLGRFERAVTPFREAIRLDPRFIPAYSNLAATLLALNKFEESRLVLRQAAENKLDFAGARRLSYLLAFVEGDAATMNAELDASVGVGETNAAFGWQAHTSAFAGHIATAHEQFRRGIQMSLQGNFTEVAAQLMVEDAEIHAVVGQCQEARSEVGPGLELSRDNATLERASRILALCGSPGEVQALAGELLRRFPEATLTRHLFVPVATAALALRQGDAAGAIERLEGVRQYDRSAGAEFWPNYLRGQAYLRRDDHAAAAAEFQAILDHRGEHPTSMFYPLAYLGLARASVDTDPAKAREAYGKMLALWDEADAGLQPLEDARAESKQVR
jgi:tetratricopeptide (TPR) repeat protein